MGPPSRKTCWRSRANSSLSAACGSRVRRCRLSASPSKIRRLGIEVALPHHHPQRLVGQRLVVLVAHGEPGVVDRDRVGADQHHVAQRAQPMGVPSGGGPGDPPGRAVGSGAPAVEGGRELPGDVGALVVDGEGPHRVQLAGLVLEQPRGDLDPGRPERVRSPGRHGVRVGLGEDDAAYACGDELLGAGSGAAGVVAGLERHDRGGAASGLPGAGQRVGLGVRRAGAAVVALGDGASRCRPAARSRPGGWGRAERPGVAASSRARSIAACSAGVVVIYAPRVRSRTPGPTARRSRPGECRDARRHLRALPIRTFTVGPGISPGQPVTGCDRVADF